MIFLSVPILLLILLIFVLILVGLIGFPMRPNSRVFGTLWVLGLMSLAAIFAWPSKGIGWHPPAWHPVLALAVLAIPYGTSLSLRYRQLQKTRPRSDFQIFAIVLTVTIASALVFRWYNTSCVFNDYHHDNGQAWCPVSWQAKLTSR